MEAPLGYCLNVHPTPSLDRLIDTLAGEVDQVRRLSGFDPLGVGLFLPRAVLDELGSPNDGLERLRGTLTDHRLQPYTLNAFPYEHFHAERVKLQVYEPDWSTPERCRYTLDAARILAELIGEGACGSLSSLAGGQRTALQDEVRCAAMGRGLIEAALGLERIELDRGRWCRLALEPEPFTLCETAAELAAFITRHVDPVLAGGAAPMSPERFRRYVGMCLDTCHAAVMSESAEAMARDLAQAGLDIVKVQLSVALKTKPGCTPETLWPFARDRYLHQAMAGDGERIMDLPLLLMRHDARQRLAETEWRIHCHVPIFTEQLAQPELTTTLPELLAMRELIDGCPHREVETYTLGVLPAGLIGEGGIVGVIARELGFARTLLRPGRAGSGSG